MWAQVTQEKVTSKVKGYAKEIYVDKVSEPISPLRNEELGRAGERTQGYLVKK